MKPTTYLFSVYQSLVVTYKNYAYQAPGIQTGHKPEINSSHRAET